MIVEVSNLDVAYKDVHAVKDVSFQVKPGEIFGMIGANGAGKTTIIECIEGLRTNYKGSITVLGINPQKERKKLTSEIGVQLQETQYQDKIKVKEIGKLFESFYSDPDDFDRLLSDFDLLDKRNSYIGKLSGGQRQKLSIILALVGKPKIVFLDEITTGLDPKSRREIWEKIKKLRDSGTTVYLTTHFMDEAEYLCDRIAIVRKGRIVAIDTLDNLIRTAKLNDVVSFNCNQPIDLKDFLSWEGVVSCENTPNYRIECHADLFMNRLSAYAESKKITFFNVVVKRPSLEDVFFKYTGEALSESEEAPVEKRWNN